MDKFNEIIIAEELIRKKSITPIDDGCIEYLKTLLTELGFKCHILPFSDDNSPTVINLYAKYGNSQEKNFAFAGHTDVVPTGEEKLWNFSPFAAEIKDGVLYGRGAVDMKGAIASFIAAVQEFLEKKTDFQDSISFIITGDEEGIAINGTQKIVEWLQENNEKISHCLVGEPTNPHKLGEMIKVGRRGSVNFTIKALGKQGHVAYPENALNPITSLIASLNLLKNHHFDDGTEYFDPTNLEVTSFDVGNPTTNIIPESATAKLNIRFNSDHQSEDIVNLVKYTLDKTLHKYELEYRVSGESFYNKDKFFSKLVLDSVAKITKEKTILSTTGGTSDARFLKDICPCVEFGLINKTAHQIDENIAVKDLTILKECYKEILENYFC